MAWWSFSWRSRNSGFERKPNIAPANSDFDFLIHRSNFLSHVFIYLEMAQEVFLPFCQFFLPSQIFLIHRCVFKFFDIPCFKFGCNTKFCWRATFPTVSEDKFSLTDCQVCSFPSFRHLKVYTFSFRIWKRIWHFHLNRFQLDPALRVWSLCLSSLIQ